MEAAAQPRNATVDDGETMKLAIAVALLKSKLLQNKQQNQSQPSQLSSPHHSDEALKWKRKAKERKEEIQRLHEDLKAAEDGVQYDMFPKQASCKCYFFDNLRKLTRSQLEDSTINDVLRRRFLRQVRINERRRSRTGALPRRRLISEHDGENELEQLSSSVDFLVELCETMSPGNLEQTNFKNWAHQAVDFILAALKNLTRTERNLVVVEGIVGSLITRLLIRTSTPASVVQTHPDIDILSYVQHVARKLGAESFVGQRIILSVSQRISLVAESLLFMDPFDDAFPSMHSCMHMMIQLIEFLVSDYLMPWSTSEDFDLGLFETWLASILHSRKGLELLESRNGLYILYLDRVIGGIAKNVANLPFFHDLNPDVVANLFS
ncbi:hypothetical protein LIER_07373 [Lithospermum erythrorhizon]|uniref:Protein MULTIPOLAR SPINDLE 1 n=1 Tax=Lithospermum erythrorhizon TaxID=34254 RepID=A0AAV3P7T9_LITER